MAVSVQKRQQIIDYSGSMTIPEIAKKVGVRIKTVKDVLSNTKLPAKASEESELPAHACESSSAHAREWSPTHERTHADAYAHASAPMDPSDVAAIMWKHLLYEMELYDDAKSRQSMDPQAKWEVVQHEKLVQSAIVQFAKWFGMDKGEALKGLEQIRRDPFQSMTDEELLRLYEITRG